MRYFVNWCLFIVLGSSVNSAVNPCFTYEVFCHVNPGVVGAALPAALANVAVNNYGHAVIAANHNPAAIAAGLPSSSISVGQFGMPGAVWAPPQPFVAPPLPMTLANINLMIARRLAHGVRVRDNLQLAIAAALAAAPALASPLPLPLLTSLRNGGYLNNLSALFNRLTLNAFPPGTILGVQLPAFVPNSVVVHISLHRRVSKNLNELSHSSLSTPLAAAVPGAAPVLLPTLTLKDRINVPFIIAGLQVPDSATIVSSDHLQVE
jgi:hypothetical protein